ncbi:MAG: hypothetical protein R2712_20595 [Vicinamibacterales bacterium]
MSSLIVTLDDTGRTAEVMADLESMLATRGAALSIVDWETRAPFYGQVRGLYVGIFVVLGVIIGCLVALSVANTLLMSVMERVRVRHAAGHRDSARSQLAALMTFEALWLAVLGSALSSVLAIAATLTINALHIEMPPPPAAVDPIELAPCVSPGLREAPRCSWSCCSSSPPSRRCCACCASKWWRPWDMSSRPLLLALLVPALLLAGSAPAQDTLLRRSDVGAFVPASFRARLTIDRGGDASDVEIYRSGTERTLLRFLAPKERGKFLLRRGADLWLIAPDARKPVRLSPSHRVYGAATMDVLFSLQLADDYEIVSAGGLGRGDVDRVRAQGHRAGGTLRRGALRSIRGRHDRRAPCRVRSGDRSPAWRSRVTAGDRATRRSSR